MRKTLTGLLAGLSMTLAGGVSIHAAQSEELTILWAEWDPANYLQELVNEYQKETGVKVTVETVPWPDFQTKAFTEFNAQGSAYDLVVGDSQWLGAGSTGVTMSSSPTSSTQHNLTDGYGPGDNEVLLGVSGWFGPLLVGSARGRRRSAGPTARTGSRIRTRWPPSRPSTATIWPCRRPGKQLLDIAEFFNRPAENLLRRRDLHA